MAFLANLFNIGANKLLNVAIPAALNVGRDFASGLVQRELTRAQRNDSDDAFKALVRAAANAVSPTAALGQTAVPAGGPATGTAFAPPTLIPPSIQPARRVLQTNPDFFPRNDTFTASRRADFAFDPARSTPQVRPVGFMSSAASKLFQAFRTPINRRMAGLTAAGVGVETAATFGINAILNPSVATAPSNGFSGIASSGPALRITGGPMPSHLTAPAATGLPAVGRYQKEANGCFVQWYFFDGNEMVAIDRSQAACVKRDCIYRLDVFKGKFVKMKSRRMNPMNVSAFFRSGRRVDAGERICRKMFSEKRKQKTGTVRRKSKAKK